MSVPRGKQGSRQEAFESMRADYSAAKQGRFRRRRLGISTMGSGADYHYRNEADFLRIMEYARDMDRNDAIVGQMVDRAVQNIVQEGLTPDPQTGDAKLDQAIKDRWWEWAGVDVNSADKAGGRSLCSEDGEMVFRDLEKLALRQMFVDGDDFTILTEEGTLQLVEAHRCRTPQATKRNVVHGVLLDEQRKRLEYWFTKDDVDPLTAIRLVSQIDPRPAFDGDGFRNILHLRNPKRITQTRGVSAFAPVFDLLGMHEDLNFAKLVQQQVASCIAFVRNRSENFQGTGALAAVGKQTIETFDAQKRLIQELAPGIELAGLPGETINGFSPNIPNAEFFQQMRTVLQLIGVNLGLPLVLLLMDASDTNFSGWRGAMDTARMGFRDMQRHLIDHWHATIYQWKLRDFARTDPAMRTALASRSGTTKFFKHDWHAPRWAYIQPLQDGQATDLQQKKLMKSPRRIHNDQGGDWNQTITETVQDNSTAIRAALAEAKKISNQTGEKITWREVLFLTDYELSGVKGRVPDAIDTTGNPATPATQPPATDPETDEPVTEPEDPTDPNEPPKEKRL